jgi:superfamily II DNA/RNA helicase
VFNFDVPINAEDYVHRIGRTGRAGRSGIAYTIASPDDGKFIAAIERLIGKKIPPLEAEGFVAPVGDGSPEPAREERGGRGRSGGGGSERGRGGRSGRSRSGERPAAAQAAVETNGAMGAGWGPSSDAPEAVPAAATVALEAPVAAAVVPSPLPVAANAPTPLPPRERAPRRETTRETHGHGAGPQGGRGFDEDGVPAFLLRGRRAAG